MSIGSPNCCGYLEIFPSFNKVTAHTNGNLYERNSRLVAEKLGIHYTVIRRQNHTQAKNYFDSSFEENLQSLIHHIKSASTCIVKND